MDIYLVGGAVRDRLLGLTVTERDWVVVGATESDLVKQGYRSVGRDFPVFLHPKTREEYALARTERKSGPGHKGFECFASPEVTLEEDLMRRDLTINAIAQDQQGSLIDPYSGAKDLELRQLRHVSAAFEEDPLRILRVARFLARFHHLGFTVAPETMHLMKTMVARGDLQELTPERVFMELQKALSTRSPREFFVLLQQLGADIYLWPELQQFNLLARLASDNPRYRYASLFADLSDIQARTISQKLKCPKDYLELACLTTTSFTLWQSLPALSAEARVEFIHQLDAIRRRERFQDSSFYFGLLSSAKTPELDTRQIHDDWNEIARICASITIEDLPPGLIGSAIKDAMRVAQISAVDKLTKD